MRKNLRIKTMELKNKALVAGATAGTAIMMATPVLASEDTVSTALQTGLNTAKSDVMGYVAVILPIGLGVMGAIWGIKKGIAFFRSVAK